MDVETRVALALREEAAKFRDPVYYYVEGEYRHRLEQIGDDVDVYSENDEEIESWKILARAAIAAMAN